MQKIFRVIYPFIIYVFIANILMLAASYIMSAAYMVNCGDVNFNAAYSYVIGVIDDQAIYWTAGGAAIASLVLAPLYKRDCVIRGGLPAEKNRTKGIAFIVLLGISACVAGNNFITLIRLDMLFPAYGEVAEQIFQGSLLIQLLCVGVLVPIAEEMVFRVLGFRRLRDYMGFMPSALIASVLFGLYHGNVVQGVYAFILGFVMAYAYELYDRAAVPIVIHISANVFSVLITMLPVFSATLGIVYLLGGTAAAILTGIVSLKKIRFYGLTNE